MDDRAEPGRTLLGPLSSTSRNKLGADVTHYLRDALVSGAFEAGQRMGVKDLAEQLGVSGMPIREALVALASEGLVEELPRRGFRVGKIHSRDILDTFRVHAFVAGLLAEEAACAITPTQVQRLRSIQGQINEFMNQERSPTNLVQVEQANFEFHRLINTVVEAPRLQWMVRITTRLVPANFISSIPGWAEASVGGHPAIIEALADGDGERARSLVEDHVLTGGRLVAANLSEHRQSK